MLNKNSAYFVTAQHRYRQYKKAKRVDFTFCWQIKESAFMDFYEMNSVSEKTVI